MQSVFKILIADGGQRLCGRCKIMKGWVGVFLSSLISDKDQTRTACCTEDDSQLWAEGRTCSACSLSQSSFSALAL